MTRTTAFLLVIGLASTAEAEPTFLAKQYTRCTACHYSPTGGGLLTPYGRLLSHRELSTTGGTATPTPDATDDLLGEPAFLFGALGNVLGPVHLGPELRPAHLGIGFPGGHQDIDLLMNADPVGALQKNDQVYGLEVSDTIGPSLVQVMVSPGKAEAILHDSSRRGFSTAGRWQVDLSSRATLVGSAFYRRATEVDPKSGAGGIAFGFAPTSHVSIWTEADTDLETKAAGGRSYVVVNETSVEVYRGIWLKFSPQLRTSGEVSGDSTVRLGVAADLLPRTHWNVNLGYAYEQVFDAGSTSTLLAQLHLFM